MRFAAPSLLLSVAGLLLQCSSREREFAGPGGAGGEGPTSGGEGPQSVGGEGVGTPEPSAGRSNEPAAGGAAGAPQDSGCLDDSDCADVDPCNGSERCVDGECVTDAVPCGVLGEGCACAADADGECATVAADADGDGHGSAGCVVQPGDDCDDADPDTHPGAAEVCDSNDNDCNGLRDIDDGLALFDRVAPLAPSSATSGFDIAWSPDARAYGVAWVDPVLHNGFPIDFVHFGLVDLAGSYSKTLDSLVSLDGSSAYQLKMLYGYGEFGVSYVRQASGGGPVSISLQRVGKTGKAALGPALDVAVGTASVRDHQVLRPNEHDWIVVWSSYTGEKPLATRIHDGEIVGAESAVPLDAFMSFGAGSAALAATSFSVGDELKSHWLAFSDSLVPVAGGPLATTLESSTLVASKPGAELGVLFASYVAAEERFYAFAADAPACSDVRAPFTPKSWPSQVIKNPFGWLLLHGDSSAEQGYAISDMVISQVFGDCSASNGAARAPIEPTATTEGLKASGGDAGSAVLWRNASKGALFARLFGPNLCDAPE